MKLSAGAKWLVRVTVGLLLLPVVLYLILLAFNRHDEPAGPEAARFEAMYRQRAAIAERDNAYVYLLGWGHLRDNDAAHKTRDVWTYVTLKAACSAADRACMTLLEQSPKEIARALDDSWMQGHYRKLIAHPQWQVPIPLDVNSTFASYVTALDGQRLLLLSAWKHAQTGDAAAVQAELAMDHRFWRMTLGSTEDLISKMIASVALRRNMEWGNMVLAQLPHAAQTQAMPEQWQTPLTLAERSMLLPMLGEYKFMENSLTSSGFTSPADALGMSALSWSLMSPLMQRQATLNQWARANAALVKSIDVEIGQFPAALKQMKALEGAPKRAWSLGNLYNPIGKALVTTSSVVWSSYSGRTGDVEGVRRAVVLAAALRSDKVDSAQAAQRIAASALRNPNDALPFGWHAASRSIVFNGLEQGARGRYRLPL